ncbi:hypothetical protein BDR26DRAFT_920595 [Obelidium mucronatum]|nr:hypothetical protein BDR26DRAFT_920595 [Obelidium mucronatum]
MHLFLILVAAVSQANCLSFLGPREAPKLTKKDNAKNLTYYGGPILQNVEVTPIFYGTVQRAADIVSFNKFLVKSTIMDIMIAEYSVPSQKMGYGTVKSPIYITSGLKSSLDDTADTAPFLRDLVSTGKIQPTANSYYPIYLQSGVNATLDDNVACVDICGYHGVVDISDISDKVDSIAYAILPDQSGWCMGGCGASSDPFENLSSVATHELTEAITDPMVSFAWEIGSPLGWYNSELGEIADICNGVEEVLKDTTGKKWVVQQIWSNKYEKCLAKYPSVARILQPTTTTSTTTKTTTTSKTTKTTTTSKTTTTKTTTTRTTSTKTTSTKTTTTKTTKTTSTKTTSTSTTTKTTTTSTKTKTTTTTTPNVMGKNRTK